MTMMPITDTIICNVCKGKNVLINEVTGKHELCPKCKGEKNMTEVSNGKPRKTLLQG